MDYAKMKEILGSLLTEKTSSEDAEKIGSISNMLETAEKEHNELLTKSEDLRKKYIEAVKQSTFAKAPDKDIETSGKTNKSFEDCVNEVVAQRK